MADSTTAASVENFSAPMTGGLTFELAGRPAKYTVLYFYPKDNTPGCTTESIAFREAFPEFQALNTEIYGISRDSLRSHEGFKGKLGLPFELISDPEEAVCSQFGVMKMKNMYGKQVRGIERSTFIIDAQGRLVKEWRGVKVNDHVTEVLEFLKSQP
ncbi:peroxiredoxin [Massilia yuzhufengensis]|uniref:thioredoxin-dependent peroxiredoxin n=1 Tax=Massilia yuzhufengensis TaxID=1164594 RepID=A0A1I1NEQ2_9BURK|nr:peroxiredoxin [Massilia yuzhufengensis]SFC95876.1 peroxiredoxin Q/BCP [Massilia yuzhufengensis]